MNPSNAERPCSSSSITRPYRAVFSLFLVICIVTGVFSFQYYAHLQKAIRDEGRGYLQEVSQRIGNNVTRIIDDNYAALYGIASVFAPFDVHSYSELGPIIEKQQAYWKFDHLLLIDDTGAAYDHEGRSMALTNDSYLDAVFHREQGISTTQMVDNKEYIMLAITLDGVTVDQKNMVALAAIYDPTVFQKTLSMTSFDGGAFSCIISKSGTLIVRPSTTETIPLGYNVLSTISGGQMEEGYSLDQVHQDIDQNRSGQVAFTLDGVRYYMVYTSVNPDDWYLLTFVPASVVNARSDMLLSTTLLLCGLIVVVFLGLIALLMYSYYHNKRNLERIAYVDEITEGNTITRFYQLAEAAMALPDRPRYALVYTNIQKFKVLNEQYGRPVCDEMLRAFTSIISASLRGHECSGRLSGDNFCILLEYEDEQSLLQRFQGWLDVGLHHVQEHKPVWSIPITEFGVYIIEDGPTIPFPLLIDRSKLALREFSRTLNNRLRYAIYNHEAHQKLFREKYLEDRMEQALQQGEFQVYLQPKYYMPDQKIGGAEALARWISPTEGTIFPNEFIPLFEKNGFIVQLDQWMFEQVCQHLRAWLDYGLQPMKISVNCSRVQLNDPLFLNAYRDIAQRYQVPPEFIEIELTESVVMEDVQRLTSVIDEIHDLGFGCSMDDFGSGYSSLNLIRSIPVDTLKLDRIFFQQSDQYPQRTQSVVGSIVSMAKALNMSTVAEGVEEQAQVDMLRNIGCDYVQGYVYAKPMPIEAFEALAFNLSKK